MNHTEDTLWYLILDGIVLATCSIGILVSLSFLFLVIIFYHRTYSAVHLIACNTQAGILLATSMSLYSTVEVFIDDLKDTEQFATLCIWRSYFVYTGIALIFYSFVIQSYYGYMRVIYSSKPEYSSIRVISIMIVMQWILLHVILLALPLNHVIDYDLNSHMCFISLTRYVALWLVTVFIYTPAYNILTYVYIRLVIFIKNSRQRAASVNASNARRELELIKRMILVLFIFSVAAIPYNILAIMAIFNPNLFSLYRYRVITLFNCFALTSASLTIFIQSTDVRRTIIDRLIRCKRQRIQPR